MNVVNMSVQLIDSMGDDLAVVNAARVSFDKQTKEFTERDGKLIKYLASHAHWTPFGHCFATFRIKAPIFVARQLAKHQVGLVWNEVSRRYVDSKPEFYMPEHWRARADNVKQGSSDDHIINMDSEGYKRKISFVIDEYLEAAEYFYEQMLKANVCPEQARMILPQNTMTEWIWSGSLAAFARVCRLRLDSHTQKETREIADLINLAMSTRFPVSWRALMEI
jgi:thymidylate synthase (FAD)